MNLTLQYPLVDPWGVCERAVGYEDQHFLLLSLSGACVSAQCLASGQQGTGGQALVGETWAP